MANKTVQVGGERLTLISTWEEYAAGSTGKNGTPTTARGTFHIIYNLEAATTRIISAVLKAAITGYKTGATLTANGKDFRSGVAALATPTEKAGEIEIAVVFKGSGTRTGVIGPKKEELTIQNAYIEFTYEVPDTEHNVYCRAEPTGTGTLTANPAKQVAGGTVTLIPAPATGYKLSGYEKTGGTISGNTLTMQNQDVTVTAKFAKETYTITPKVATNGTGTLEVSKTSANYGDKITLTPKPANGYEFGSYQVTGRGTISGNTLTVLDGDATVTVTFTKKVYTATITPNPAGAGTLSLSPGTGLTMGTEVTIQKTDDNAEYTFGGYTSSPTVSIANNTFTMPANNVAIVANYLHRSTGTLNSSSVTPGSPVTLTINTENRNYTHKYKWDFGTGMASDWNNVPAGQTSVHADEHLYWAWCEQIPNATSKPNGKLLLRTYLNGNQIGNDYVISGLTFNVPTSLVPSITTLTAQRNRTIKGKEYADLGVYVQSHCGANISATAQGASRSTIVSMSLEVVGYTGNDYKKTAAAASISMTTGLLTTSGEVTIKATAMDSRGRTATSTIKITVEAYRAPTITKFNVWRVDSDGNQAEMGEYGKYDYEYSFTNVGSDSNANAIQTVKLSDGSGASQTITPGTSSNGNLMPNGRKQYPLTNSYAITLEVADKLEKATVTVYLPTGTYIFYVDDTGHRVGIGKAATKQIPTSTGKNGTFEISDDMQIYYGNETLEDYLRRVLGL